MLFKHLTSAFQALSNGPREAKRVFELASERKHDCFLGFCSPHQHLSISFQLVTQVVWCQVFQQSKDLVDALNTLATSNSMSVTPNGALYTVLPSCGATMKSLSAIGAQLYTVWRC